MIITDKNIRHLFGELISKYFKKKELAFFDDVTPNPKDSMINNNKDFVIGFQPEVIIGFGGGSVMDTAKMLYFLYESKKDSIYECNPITSYNLGKKSRLILIPTTSGTGAEHTPASIITNSETGQKVALASNELIPESVILDPKLCLKMSEELTIVTCLDAFVHAIEGMTSKFRSDFSDAANLHAIKLIIKYLPNIIENNYDDIKIREKLHNAASIAGIGMANSSCGLAHSFGHALGAVYDIKHGLAVGIMLPYIIEYNRVECEANYIEILQSINILDTKNPASILAEFIRSFLKRIKISFSLNYLVNEEMWNKNIDNLFSYAKKDILTPFNPRKVNENEFRKIFDYAYIGKSIDF